MARKYRENANILLGAMGSVVGGLGISVNHTADQNFKAELAALQNPQKSAEAFAETSKKIEDAHTDAERGAGAAAAGLLTVGAAVTSLWRESSARKKT